MSEFSIIHSLLKSLWSCSYANTLISKGLVVLRKEIQLGFILEHLIVVKEPPAPGVYGSAGTYVESRNPSSESSAAKQ